MGAAYGKKKGYNIDHEPRKLPCLTNGKHPNSRVSTYANQHDSVRMRPSPFSSYASQPDYVVGDEHDLIKPKKLPNPVKASRSHQELHRELLSSCKRGVIHLETKPELQRVLETRRRDQLIKLKKQEEEAHRKITPLEVELTRRHHKLEELEQQEQQENLRAPEFIKVKENLRRTSLQHDEKEV